MHPWRERERERGNEKQWKGIMFTNSFYKVISHAPQLSICKKQKDVYINTHVRKNRGLNIRRRPRKLMLKSEKCKLLPNIQHFTESNELLRYQIYTARYCQGEINNISFPSIQVIFERRQADFQYSQDIPSLVPTDYAFEYTFLQILSSIMKLVKKGRDINLKR